MMPMTNDELTEHRLKALEEIVPGFRQTERDVDLLKASVLRYEADSAAMDARLTARDEQLHRSLTRLHTRLDELMADERFQAGARSARVTMWRTVAATLAATAAVAGIVFGAVTAF